MDKRNQTVTVASEYLTCDVCEAQDGVKSSVWLPVLRLPILKRGVLVSTGVGLRCLRCQERGRTTDHPVNFNWLPAMVGLDGDI